MLTLPLSKIERSVFWISFAVITLVYILGSAVSVTWGNTPIPVLTVLKTLRLGSVLKLEETGGWLIALAGAGLLGFRYATMTSWQLRVLLLSSGLLLSVLIVSDLTGSFWNAIALVGFAVPWTLQAAFGLADGEFYVEDTPEAAAAGLWMLHCIVFLIREFVRGARNRGLAESSAPNAGSAGAAPAVTLSFGNIRARMGNWIIAAALIGIWLAVSTIREFFANETIQYFSSGPHRLLYVAAIAALGGAAALVVDRLTRQTQRGVKLFSWGGAASLLTVSWGYMLYQTASLPDSIVTSRGVGWMGILLLFSAALAAYLWFEFYRTWKIRTSE